MAERFSSVLVANRGEIALRIMKTARALGYRTVAVASDADREAPHAAFADECVVLGPGPSSESYLRTDRIIEAAEAAGAGAIHPGYGFLSENAAFAKAVREAGRVFIGPPADAIAAMGDKAEAKRRMISAGVPCIPGYQDTEQSPDVFRAAAEKAGYPVMIKAAAGGGGRGMRRVASPDALGDALESARSEAQAAFGSGELILEKAIEHARHVEVQVFGDEHGSIIHLGERDCSLQRRNQKVIEEAPSPAVDETLRLRMGEAAVNAARAVDYVGAGTVEFLLDDDGAFYFLEMNTRLQVEHPVTELVTGLDLVALQLRVAQGEPLGIRQEDVALSGHAIEARLYAEDPYNDFMPSTGRIHLWSPSSLGRTDSGLETSGEVSPFYDPMVAKVVAHGTTRSEARRALIRSLEDTVLLGPTTNRTFLLRLLSEGAFVDGEARTGDIDREGVPPQADHGRTPHALAAAIQYTLKADAAASALSLPHELLQWSSSETLRSPFRYDIDGEDVELLVEPTGRGLSVIDGETTSTVENLLLQGNKGRATVDGMTIQFAFVEADDTLHLHLPYTTLTVSNQLAASAQGAGGDAEGAVSAPMHGLLTELFVAVGTQVDKGDRVALVEAMKMQHEIRAQIAGEVETVSAKQGDQVAGGQVLVIIKPTMEKTS